MIINISKDFLDSINTSESYNKSFYLFKDYLICPYINLQIIDNDVVNGFKENDKLNYSYLIFKGVSWLDYSFEINNKITYKRCNISDKEEDLIIDYISGYDLSDTKGNEFKVSFRDEYLYVFDNVKVINNLKKSWSPVSTSFFSKNIKKNESDYFFNKENIPEEIINFIGAADCLSVKELVLS